LGLDKNWDTRGLAANIKQIVDICGRKGRILVLTQDNPDPDALASAAALRELIHDRLKKRVAIGYGGICGRAENVAMMEELRIDARHITISDLNDYAILCLVDALPRSGNSILASRDPHIVIDHHILPKKRTWTAEFADIRPHYGSTSTILYEYLLAAKIRPNPKLATALFYGIQSDTQDLGREASAADINAYRDLFLIADKRKLSRIRHAPVPADYFAMLIDGLSACAVAGTTILSYIPSCHNADMIAEMADFLLRLRGMRAAVCYGVCGGKIILSARTVDARGNAARRMRRVVSRIGTGGGHRTMAGGQIPLEGDPEKRIALVQSRILRYFASSKEPVPLASLARSKPCCQEPGNSPKPSQGQSD